MRALLAIAAIGVLTGMTACAPIAVTRTPEDPLPTAPAPESQPSPAGTDSTTRPLVLWVTPRFSPTTGSPSGDLLAARLDEFERDNPGLVIEVRTKEAAGPGGLFEALATASQAAPTSLPDLVALDAAALRDATLKELIVPLGEFDGLPPMTEWYPFALETARFDGSLIAVPFASDAEAFAYRSDRYARPPLAWDDVLDGPTPVLFPAGDPTASFTLAQYLSLGGRLLDDNGRPVLEAEVLAQVLGFFDSARRSGVLPLSARQFADSTATWIALRDDRAQAVTAAFSDFLAEQDPATDALQPLPTLDGSGTCVADVYSWALVTRDPERQELVMRLITWLTEPEFIAEWTFGLGLLPSSASALAQWPDGPQTAAANRLVTVAHARPTTEVLATFGPALHAAVDSVLTGEASPEVAAQAAALALHTP